MHDEDAGAQWEIEGVVRIPLCRRDGSIRTYALVDANDADWANQWRWHLGADGYAVRNQYDGGGRKAQGSSFRMHRELLGLTSGDRVEGDHINRDRLDNRRSNLRSTPKLGNRQNVPARGGTSSYRGVSQHPKTKRWRVQVRANSKQVHIGYFASETEAAEVARAARARLMPFAVD